MKVVKSCKYYTNKEKDYIVIELNHGKDDITYHMLDVNNNTVRCVHLSEISNIDWILINACEL